MPSKHLMPDWNRVIHSRDVNELLPTVRKKCVDFLTLLTNQGVDVLLATTYLDHEAQAKLYARGRTAPGRIVTYEPPLHSWNNWRCAFNVVPIWFGRPLMEAAEDLDDIEFWHRVGDAGEACGLTWGGRWEGEHRRFSHFHYDYGMTIEQVISGMPLPETLEGPIGFMYRSSTRHAFGVALGLAWRDFVRWAHS